MDESERQIVRSKESRRRLAERKQERNILSAGVNFHFTFTRRNWSHWNLQYSRVLVAVQFSTGLIGSWNGHNDNHDNSHKKAIWQRVYGQFGMNIIIYLHFNQLIITI